MLLTRCGTVNRAMQYAVGLSILNELQRFVCLSAFSDMCIVCKRSRACRVWFEVASQLATQLLCNGMWEFEFGPNSLHLDAGQSCQLGH